MKRVHILITTIIAVIAIASVLMFPKPKAYYLPKGNLKDSLLLVENRPLTNGFAGYLANTLDEVRRRSWIMKNATIPELENLLHYPDGSIKTVGYEGLIRKKNYPQKKNLILSSFADTVHFTWYREGCISKEMPIHEYLVQMVLEIDTLLPPPFEKRSFGLTEKEEQEILTLFYHSK